MAHIRNRFKILLAQKEARDDRQYTYSDISEATGVSPTTLSSYARNSVSRFDAVTIVALCDWLECEIGDLLVYPPDLSQQGLQPAIMAAA